MSRTLSLALSVALSGTAAPVAHATPARTATPACSSAFASTAYGRVPLAFEANLGQHDSEVSFVARGSGYTLWATDDEAVLGLVRPATGTAAAPAVDVVRMQLAGASADASVRGEERLSRVVHQFTGNDPARWRRNIPTFARVRYASVYPGIDLVYYGRTNALEYDFVVAPGADPSAIALRFVGAESVRVAEDGSLVLRLAGRDVRWRAPVIHQTIESRRIAVAGGYRLTADARSGAPTVGFAVASYDRTAPLVIDPILDYSTYLGGSGTDQAYDVAVDESNHPYVTGYTASIDFPLANAAQAASAGAGDVFVTKLTAAGDDVIYSTYLGGTNTETAAGIAVDSFRAAYVTGYTLSNNFPTTAGAYDVGHNGLFDVFVVKLDPDGQIVYGTYVGGAGNEWGKDIAVEGGRAYVTGYTGSNPFPTTANAYDTGFNGGTYDAFAFRLGPAGAVLSYSTYLGGVENDYGYGIALSDTEAVVTGQTWSVNFPTLAGFDMTHNGDGDVFVTRMAGNGQSLVASTFVGGSDTDSGEDVALGDGGHVYIAGWTESTNFPTTAGAHDITANGITDVFVTKLNPALLTQTYSTYVGGSSLDVAFGIAVNSFGGALVAGYTVSSNFPTVNPTQAAFGGGTADAFVFRVAPPGDALNFSTYLGGPGGDLGEEIALDGCGLPYVVGVAADGFPTTTGAFDTTFGGGLSDAFVTKITP